MSPVLSVISIVNISKVTISKAIISIVIVLSKYRINILKCKPQISKNDMFTSENNRYLKMICLMCKEQISKNDMFYGENHRYLKMICLM